MVYFSDLVDIVIFEGWWFRKFVLSSRCSSFDVTLFCFVHQGKRLLLHNPSYDYLDSTNSTLIVSCCQKHSLLQRVFAIYGSLPQAAKQVLHPTFSAMPIETHIILSYSIYHGSYV
jgi:hypothetical protein